MAKGLNRVQLLGHMGKAAEIRSTQSGHTVANFSLATAERVKVNGEWKDATEWHTLVAFGRIAEILRDYTSKGSKLLVEGRLQTRSWDDKESGQKKYRTEIIVSDITLLDGRKDNGQVRSHGDDGGYEMHPAVSPNTGDITDDDIPF
jgi:single-strand DNA-binding protein